MYMEFLFRTVFDWNGNTQEKVGFFLIALLFCLVFFAGGGGVNNGKISKTT